MDWSLVLVIATVLIIPTFIYGLISQVVVDNTFDKYSNVAAKCGITASELARKLLTNAGINDIEVVRINGKLSDCYDPRHKVVKLSDSTYNSTSVAALGVCAHEIGHAVQHKKGMFLFKLRLAIVPVVNLISKLLFPIMLVGFILSFTFYIPTIGYYFVFGSLILYGSSLLFYLVTLPVEFDASKKAMALLENTKVLESNELNQAKEVLNAAIHTYISTFLITLLYFLRFLSYAVIFNRRK